MQVLHNLHTLLKLVLQIIAAHSLLKKSFLLLTSQVLPLQRPAPKSSQLLVHVKVVLISSLPPRFLFLCQDPTHFLLVLIHNNYHIIMEPNKFPTHRPRAKTLSGHFSAIKLNKSPVKSAKMQKFPDFQDFKRHFFNSPDMTLIH